ncbi:ribulose-phosphate 3-epimerase [Actinopolymorpha cephalotaxi]|uniref:Ribulose-phosphate 3-epimerase n=1 Tax=Actinopolymorpha cephalotaxi TaxID=504797 RepID=A0A1I2V9P1_9ACTN|nr:ribulose-phosphate 3-epimerase [Actinopolymorpha cephalotaxi]NYH84795.1 ribulose-phosphate 3-epimerase [Actinopolymorpha cephalotaxi]SFG85870.1 ribulose-phosphate 3-epimerase [Actinopolymorpha cephalotaxi]
MEAYVSLWSADLLDLGAAVDRLAGVADGFHLDVFDGHAVPDLLFGPDLVAALRDRTDATLDVHLMVARPDDWIDRFADAGADLITVHTSACPDVRTTLRSIRSRGVRAGLGLETHEPTGHAVAHFDDADRVLVMGTVVGVKGCEQDPATPARVGDLVAARTAGRAQGSGSAPRIVVDGGIRPHTVPALARAGADGVVPGSLVFGAGDPASAVRWLHDLPAGTGDEAGDLAGATKYSPSVGDVPSRG